MYLSSGEAVLLCSAIKEKEKKEGTYSTAAASHAYAYTQTRNRHEGNGTLPGANIVTGSLRHLPAYLPVLLPACTTALPILCIPH